MRLDFARRSYCGDSFNFGVPDLAFRVFLFRGPSTNSSRNNKVCAFLGHNGSGKTTTINVLTGVVRPERGSVSVDGTDLLTEGGLAYARSITGVCVQHNINFAFLTVRENLELVARLRLTER